MTSVAVERSGPAIRAALAEHASEDCACFEVELRTALAGRTPSSSQAWWWK
ncbi:MAG: hypothetical protein ACRDTH_14385 [Pseudonocardiaceae bacterium]